MQSSIFFKEMSKENPMKYNDVLSIIKDFENSKLTSLELEIEDIKIKMTKNDTFQQEVSLPVNNEVIQTSKKVEKSSDNQGYAVKSPLVGTFYASASPESDPFVRVGDTVKKGDTLCIIEAMKIMNEISAPINGQIKSIKVKNGDTIGFDQILMLIEDAK